MAEDSGDGEEVLALRAGDRGDEVEKAQKKLKELGYYTYGSITGYFGPVTKDAVIRLSLIHIFSVGKVRQGIR